MVAILSLGQCLLRKTFLLSNLMLILFWYPTYMMFEVICASKLVRIEKFQFLTSENFYDRRKAPIRNHFI